MLDSQKTQPRSTLRGFLLYSPVSILGFCVSVLLSEPSASFPVLFLLGIALTAVTFLLYLLLLKIELALSTDNRLTSYTCIAITAVITGGFRGYLFFKVLDYFNYTQPSSEYERILNSALTALFWLTFANYAISSSRNFRSTYQQVLTRFLLVQKGQQQSEISASSAKSLSVFESNLKKSLSKYLGSTESHSFIQLSHTITQQINEELKPLSQRIWIRSLDQYPVVDIRQLLHGALKRLEYRESTFILVMTGLSIINNLAIRGISETVIRTLTYLIPSYFLLKLLRPLKARITIGSSLIYLASISIPPLVISEAVLRLLSYKGDWTALLLITPIPAVVVYVLSLIRLTSKDREYILELFNSLGQLPHETNETSLASYLHNSLQSELLALSAKLQSAAISGEKEESEKLLQEVSSLVNRSIADDFSKFAESPLDKLESLQSSWRGLLEITFNVEPDQLQNLTMKSTLVQAVQEVASNVFRYDQATTLIVSINESASGLRIEFQSDGKGEITQGSGLGNTWLDSVAFKPWTIEKNQLGTNIILEL